MKVGDLYKSKEDISVGFIYIVKIVNITQEKVLAKHLVGVSIIGFWSKGDFSLMYEPVTKLEKYLHDYE